MDHYFVIMIYENIMLARLENNMERDLIADIFKEVGFDHEIVSFSSRLAAEDLQ